MMVKTKAREIAPHAVKLVIGVSNSEWGALWMVRFDMPLHHASMHHAFQPSHHDVI
jgi:hypothetical protein